MMWQSASSLVISWLRSCCNMAIADFLCTAAISNSAACSSCHFPPPLESVHAAYTVITAMSRLAPSTFLPTRTVPLYRPHPRQSRMALPALLLSAGSTASVHSPTFGSLLVFLVQLWAYLSFPLRQFACSPGRAANLLSNAL